MNDKYLVKPPRPEFLIYFGSLALLIPIPAVIIKNYFFIFPVPVIVVVIVGVILMAQIITSAYLRNWEKTNAEEKISELLEVDGSIETKQQIKEVLEKKGFFSAYDYWCIYDDALERKKVQSKQKKLQEKINYFKAKTPQVFDNE